MKGYLAITILALFSVSHVWCAARHEPGSWSTLTLETSAGVAEAERLASSTATCPPPGFKSLEPFSVADYLGKGHLNTYIQRERGT
jgi:hypothetical protein